MLIVDFFFFSSGFAAAQNRILALIAEICFVFKRFIYVGIPQGYVLCSFWFII